MQRGPLRPPNVDLERLLKDLSLVPATESEQEAVQRFIDRELAHLMQHDSLVHPIPGTAHPDVPVMHRGPGNGVDATLPVLLTS